MVEKQVFLKDGCPLSDEPVTIEGSVTAQLDEGRLFLKTGDKSYLSLSPTGAQKLLDFLVNGKLDPVVCTCNAGTGGHANWCDLEIQEKANAK